MLNSTDNTSRPDESQFTLPANNKLQRHSRVPLSPFFYCNVKASRLALYLKMEVTNTSYSSFAPEGEEQEEGEEDIQTDLHMMTAKALNGRIRHDAGCIQTRPLNSSGFTTEQSVQVPNTNSVYCARPLSAANKCHKGKPLAQN